MKMAKAIFSKGIPSSEYKKLRKKTPSNDIRKKVNPEGPKKDLIYGYEVDKFEADHIVSMKEITEMDGFNLLSKEKQKEILNLEDNFVGLGKRTNASKGAHNWTDWKGHSIFVTIILSIFPVFKSCISSLKDGRLKSAPLSLLSM